MVQGSPRHGLHPKRLKLLHVARRQLAIGDDDWRSLLARVAGVVSSPDLDDIGFERVMAELNRLGFRSTSARRHFGQRPGMASPKQIALIRDLWRQYYGAEDPAKAALNAWLHRFHHVSALRFVADFKVTPILAGLKAMIARQRGRATGG